MEDKEKLAKAQSDRRLEKRKAKADHRAAASQRDTHSDRSSSHAQASTSSPDSEMSFASEPKRPRARRNSTSTTTAAASGSKRKVKAAAKTAIEAELPTRAQKRASTRSSRTSAWGKTDRALDTPGGNGVVRARQTGSASSEQGYGTAVGGLFKVCLLLGLYNPSPMSMYPIESCLYLGQCIALYYSTHSKRASAAQYRHCCLSVSLLIDRFQVAASFIDYIKLFAAASILVAKAEAAAAWEERSVAKRCACLLHVCCFLLAAKQCTIP